jgi:hypothetical protein
MEKSKSEWDGTWPRFAPSQQIMLCESCWNHQGMKHHCQHEGCACPRSICNPIRKEPKPPVAETQVKISMDNAHYIGVKS